MLAVLVPVLVAVLGSMLVAVLDLQCLSYNILPPPFVIMMGSFEHCRIVAMVIFF